MTAIDNSEPGVAQPEAGRPRTLSIDVGGTGLKASVLDVEGRKIVKRVRIKNAVPVSAAYAHPSIGPAHV